MRKDRSWTTAQANLRAMKGLVVTELMQRQRESCVWGASSCEVSANLRPPEKRKSHTQKREPLGLKEKTVVVEITWF